MDKQTRHDVDKFINELMHNYEFVEFMRRPNEENWLKVEQIHSEEFWFASGATKGVIIFDDYDFVLKMPFLFYKSYDYETGEYSEREDLDYCKLEWRNYKMAEKEELAQFFAEMDYYGKIYECPIYVQDKYDCDECTTSSVMENASYHAWCYAEGLEDTDENRDDFYDNYYCGDSEVLFEDFAYEMLDRKVACKLMEFCERNKINDLHSGNIAIGEGNDFVIVDYSGFGICVDNFDDGWFDVLAA